MMDRAAQEIDPTELVNAFIETGGGKSKAVTTELFDQFGDATARVMADGVVTLGMLWESAWRVAEAEGLFAPADLVGQDRDEPRALYEDTSFVESLDLANIGAVLK